MSERPTPNMNEEMGIPPEAMYKKGGKPRFDDEEPGDSKKSKAKGSTRRDRVESGEVKKDTAPKPKNIDTITSKDDQSPQPKPPGDAPQTAEEAVGKPSSFTENEERRDADKALRQKAREVHDSAFAQAISEGNPSEIARQIAAKAREEVYNPSTSTAEEQTEATEIPSANEQVQAIEETREESHQQLEIASDGGKPGFSDEQKKEFSVKVFSDVANDLEEKIKNAKASGGSEKEISDLETRLDDVYKELKKMGVEVPDRAENIEGASPENPQGVEADVKSEAESEIKNDLIGKVVKIKGKEEEYTVARTEVDGRVVLERRNEKGELVEVKKVSSDQIGEGEIPPPPAPPENEPEVPKGPEKAKGQDETELPPPPKVEIDPVLDRAEQPDKERRKVVIADVSRSVEDTAVDVAQRNLDEQSRNAGFFRRIWHSASRAYRRNREIERARTAILESGNINANEDPDNRDEHNRSMAALVNRFSREYEESVHEDRGEARRTLGDTPEEVEIKDSIRELISEYAQGRLTDETFEEAKNEILRKQLAGGAAQDVMDRGNLFADNLLEIARETRQAVENGEALDQLDLDFDFVVGRARLGASTEAAYNRLDKVIERIERSPIGQFVNENTIASAVTVAYSVAVGLGQRAVMNRAFTWGTLGGGAAAGGFIAGAREAKRFEDQRSLYLRERASGRTNEMNEQLENIRHNTVDAEELINNLQQAIYENYENREFRDLGTDQENLDRALISLAEIEARVRLSDRESIDLWSVEQGRNMDDARDRMDLARAETKVYLRELFENGGWEFPEGYENFDQYLESYIEVRSLELSENIQETRTDVSSVKRGIFARRFAVGAALTVAFGATAQEIAYTVSGNNRMGVADQLLGRNEAQPGETLHYSPLATLTRYLTGGEIPRGQLLSQEVGGRTVNITEGSSIVEDDGKMYLETAGNRVSEVTFNPDNTISDTSIKALGDRGIVVDSHIEHESHKETVTKSGNSFEEWRKAHPEQTHAISRSHMDNDSPIFDKNELRFDMEKRGDNVVLKVGRMDASGSYHGGNSENMPAEVSSGNARVLLSPTRGDQFNPIILEVNKATGEVEIPLNSDIGKNLFEVDSNGDPVYKGRFIEAAVNEGETGDGKLHMHVSATIVGENNTNGFDFSTTEEVTKIVDIPKNTIEVPNEAVTDAPPPIPFVPERPIPGGAKKEKESVGQEKLAAEAAEVVKQEGEKLFRYWERHKKQVLASPELYDRVSEIWKDLKDKKIPIEEAHNKISELSQQEGMNLLDFILGKNVADKTNKEVRFFIDTEADEPTITVIREVFGGVHNTDKPATIEVFGKELGKIAYVFKKKGEKKKDQAEGAAVAADAEEKKESPEGEANPEVANAVQEGGQQGVTQTSGTGLPPININIGSNNQLADNAQLSADGNTIFMPIIIGNSGNIDFGGINIPGLQGQQQAPQQQAAPHPSSPSRAPGQPSTPADRKPLPEVMREIVDQYNTTDDKNIEAKRRAVSRGLGLRLLKKNDEKKKIEAAGPLGQELLNNLNLTEEDHKILTQE